MTNDPPIETPKIGAFYWIILEWDPDLSDDERWQNDTMPARYAGNGAWYTMGSEVADDWPAVWVGQEIIETQSGLHPTPDPSLVRELHEAIQSEAGSHYLESDLGERVAQFLAGGPSSPDCNTLLNDRHFVNRATAYAHGECDLREVAEAVITVMGEDCSERVRSADSGSSSSATNAAFITRLFDGEASLPERSCESTVMGEAGAELTDATPDASEARRSDVRVMEDTSSTNLSDIPVLINQVALQQAIEAAKAEDLLWDDADPHRWFLVIGAAMQTYLTCTEDAATRKDADAKPVGTSGTTSSTNPCEISGVVDMNSPAFMSAWRTWLYSTDVAKFDRDIALMTAIESYLQASEPVSVDLEKCVSAYSRSTSNMNHGIRDWVKAVLEAAGVKYEE